MGNPRSDIGMHRSTDFESALVVTLFGVGYALVVRLVQDAISFADLVMSYFYPQFIMFLIIIVLVPFATILTYILCSMKENYVPLSARNLGGFTFVLGALIKIAVLDGAPYVFFVFGMAYLQSSTPPTTQPQPPPRVMQGKYNYDAPYSVLPLVFLVAWIILAVIYFVFEWKAGRNERARSDTQAIRPMRETTQEADMDGRQEEAKQLTKKDQEEPKKEEVSTEQNR